jgi:hypothetical protein
MASNFQPLLQGSGGAPSPVSGRYSNAISLPTGFFDDLQRKRVKDAKDEAELAAQTDLNEFAGFALGERVKTLEHSKNLQTSLEGISAIEQDGRITAEEEADYAKFNKLLEQERQAARQGQDPLVRSARIAVKAKSLIDKNTFATKDILALLNGPLGQQEGGVKQSQELTTIMNDVRRRYGPDFSQQDVSNHMMMMQDIALSEQRLLAGQMSAGQIKTQVPGRFEELATAGLRTLNTAYNTKGFYDPSDMQAYTAEINTIKDRIKQDIRQGLIERNARTGEVLSETERQALFKTVDDSAEYYLSQLGEGKDFVSRVKLLVETQDLMFSSQKTFFMKFLKEADSLAGIGGMNGFISLMKSPETKAIISKIADKGFLDQFDGDVDKVIASMYKLILSDADVTDPGLKKVQATIASRLIMAGQVSKTGKEENKVIDIFDDIIKRSRDNTVLGAARNVDAAVDSLMAPKFKEKLTAGLRENGDVAAAKNKITSWSNSLLNHNAELLSDDRGAVYSSIKDKFVPVSREVRAGSRNISKSQKTAESLNKLLELHSDPSWAPIVGSREEFLSLVNKRNNSILKEMAEEKARKEAEEKKRLESKQQTTRGSR